MKKFLLFLCYVIMLPLALLWFAGIFGIIGNVLSLLLIPLFRLFGVDDFDFQYFKDGLRSLIFSFVIFLVCSLLAVLVEVWKDKLKESIKKKQKQKTRAGGYSGYSGGSYSGYSGYNRTIHDELDAAEYATRITDRYGQDWSGYNPEGPGLGPDPDSYYPSGYDPEAWNGPDITGL